MKQMEANQQQANKVRRLSDIRQRDNALLSTKHLKLEAKLGKLWPQCIVPFKELQITGCKVAKLELPPAMKVHPVFNVAFLNK